MGQVIALAIMTGWAPPQATAIGHYAWRATHTGTRFAFDAELDPCAKSDLGEGLLDVTGTLRGELRRFARSLGEPIARAPNLQASDSACAPAEVQLAFLREAFPRHYPACARAFEAGDLGALQRCWGDGGSR